MEHDKYIRVTFLSPPVVQHHHLVYWQLHLDVTLDLLPLDLKNNDIMHYCLLLPKLCDKGFPLPSDLPMYGIIDSNWYEAVPDATNYHKPNLTVPKVSF